jgi:transcriptional regulator GlxA family with amidase domain
LLIPGGYGARDAAANDEVIRWCRRVATGAELVCSVGTGAAVLGAAGLLDGQRVSIGTGAPQWLNEALPGACLVQGTGLIESASTNVITASNGVDGVQLGLRIVERTLGTKLAASLSTQLGLPPAASTLTLSDVPTLDIHVR